MAIFNTADILLPCTGEWSRWSVIACDQFTAQGEYWEKAEQIVGETPSTLRLVLPEAWLDTPRGESAAGHIPGTMETYLAQGVFTTLPTSFVYVERTLSNGSRRRGLVGALDLESYDFAPDSASPVRATEDTVVRRLPPRVKVRQAAALELPHVMVLMDDREDRVLGSLERDKAALPSVYDFELMLGGGHIAGWQVSGAAATRTAAALAALEEPALLREKYGVQGAPLVFAMGDGNHSLAAAKLCWEQRKSTLTAAEREHHPARYALVELVNLHEPAVTFAPIHRLLCHTDPRAFLAESEKALRFAGAGETHTVRCLTAEGERSFPVGGTIGQLIGACEDFSQDYVRRHGGLLDYVHGDDTAETLGREADSAAFLLPAMQKAELFSSVQTGGPFPRKSFSIGQARDKRYYLEGRKIR